MIEHLDTKLSWARHITRGSYVLYLASMLCGGFLRGDTGKPADHCITADAVAAARHCP